MPAAPDKRSYTAGHFELQLDGAPTTAYLKTVDGGYAKASLIDEPIGPENHRIKHTSTVDIDPFSVELGVSGATAVLKWIQSSWRKEWSRKNGQITHANFDLKTTFTHEFFDALITETTFPALDGASKDAAYLKVKVQPEKVITKKVSSGPQLIPHMGTKQKLWTSSAFRLSIDGLDEMSYANKIDSFTIKQGVKKFYSGEDRFPQIEPTKIEFPHISGTIAAEYTDGLHDWYQKYVVKGQADPKAQKTGSLEFLTPDRKSTIFRINLFDVGLIGLSMQSSTANSDQIKRMKFELYVGRMDLDGSGALGME
jgi:hypothetical protein